MLLIVGAVLFLILSWSAPSPGDQFGFRGYDVLLAVSMVAVGPLLLFRRPDNPIGWLMTAAAVSTGFQAFT
ncbi:MAG TPA: hypothetical protein VID47_02460, partial [Actinomycetota bacterium]